MPLYEYECDACGQRFEVIQKFSDPSPEACRHCGKGPVHRLASSPAIQFKGSGFYITDYAQKGKSDPSTTSSDKPADGAKADSNATASTDGSKSKSDVAWGDSGKSDSSKSDSAKSDSGKSGSSKSDSSKSDAGASSPKPSAASTSKESKE